MFANISGGVIHFHQLVDATPDGIDAKGAAIAYGDGTGHRIAGHGQHDGAFRCAFYFAVCDGKCFINFLPFID